jgi:hypothetical protein
LIGQPPPRSGGLLGLDSGVFRANNYQHICTTMHAHQNHKHFQPTARVIRCLNIFTSTQGTRYCCRRSFGSTSFLNLSMSSQSRCWHFFRSANLSLNPYIHVCACVYLHVCVSSCVCANEKRMPHCPNTIMLKLYLRFILNKINSLSIISV